MPPGSLISNLTPGPSKRLGPIVGASLASILAVFACGRKTIDLAVSQSGSHGGGGVDGGMRADAGDSGAGESTPCFPDGGCAQGTVCIQETGRCGECTSSTEAKQCGFRRCDTATNACVECLDNLDCAGISGINLKCNRALRRCTFECTVSADCSADRLKFLFVSVTQFDICDPALALCVACTVDAECQGRRGGGSKATCLHGGCIECTKDADCGVGRRCEPYRRQCYLAPFSPSASASPDAH